MCETVIADKKRMPSNVRLRSPTRFRLIILTRRKCYLLFFGVCDDRLSKRVI